MSALTSKRHAAAQRKVAALQGSVEQFVADVAKQLERVGRSKKMPGLVNLLKTML